MFRKKKEKAIHINPVLKELHRLNGIEKDMEIIGYLKELREILQEIRHICLPSRDLGQRPFYYIHNPSSCLEIIVDTGTINIREVASPRATSYHNDSLRLTEAGILRAYEWYPHIIKPYLTMMKAFTKTKKEER